ncbi:hypothetical protein C5167_010898, partial [Papaver somniferum]
LLHYCCSNHGKKKTSANSYAKRTKGPLVETRRDFVHVNERVQVIDKDGKLVPNLCCNGDANGKLTLAHAAIGQGISGTNLIPLNVRTVY